MRPSAHILVSCTLAWICFIFTDSLIIALSVGVAGVLIDGDHLIDYLIFNGRLDKNAVGKLFSGDHFQESRKLFLPLHSYELLIPIWIIGSVFNLVLFSTWISVSFVTHLVLDQTTYAPRALTYFLIYRAMNSFDLTLLNPASLIGLTPHPTSIGIIIIGPLAPIRPQRITLSVVNYIPHML
ncbi:MAG: hypothetical protein ACFE7E_08045 [Candidatus Hodarchaeota archaeon]